MAKPPKIFQGLNVRDYVYFGTLVVAAIIFLMARSGERATVKTQLENVIKNQDNIIEKLDEQDEKWTEQGKHNTKVVTTLELIAPD